MLNYKKLFISLFLIIAIILSFVAGYTRLFSDYNVDTYQECKDKGYATRSIDETDICVTPTGKIYKKEETQVEESRVKVYLFNFNKFNEPNNTDYVSGVYRETTKSDLKTFAIEQAILGPNEDEIDLGLKPTFGENRTIWFVSGSNCSNKDFNITTQSNGYTTVKFCRETMLAGDMSGFIIEQQFESTLKEFDDVKKVRILDSKGECFNDMRGDSDPSTCYR